MFRWVEQEQFYVDDPEDLIGRIGVNGDAAVAFLLQARNCILVSQIVRQHEAVHARRHAILRSLIAELDDFLDHLSFAVVKRAFLLADLK